MVSAAIMRPTRADYYRVLADNLPPQALVVTSLGNASYLWAKLHEAPENFYFEDAMGLALPFSPLCGPDCAGLCPQCGVPLATAEPGHHHEQIDPRWAKLSGILDRDDK